MLSVQEMGHTERLEEIRGEKAWRVRTVTKDFSEGGSIQLSTERGEGFGGSFPLSEDGCREEEE